MEFKLIDNLKFVTVDMDYLRKLHKVSSEVYYKESDYENKPYLGILLSTDNYKYVIPLTSAKEKHKDWKLVETDRFLIYEIIDKSEVLDGDICKDVIGNDNTSLVYHIWSAIDIKKMIPVVDGVIKVLDISHKDTETDEEKKYKNLLNNELSFCIKIIDKIILKAGKVYDKQTTTKNGLKFCCDFKALEKVVGGFQIK